MYPNRRYAIPLYNRPLPVLYEMVNLERDRLGLTKAELREMAREFFGGEIPEVHKPADLINFTYYLRKHEPQTLPPIAKIFNPPAS